jgi:hypothetical protein
VGSDLLAHVLEDSSHLPWLPSFVLHCGMSGPGWLVVSWYCREPLPRVSEVASQAPSSAQVFMLDGGLLGAVASGNRSVQPRARGITGNGQIFAE